jgi:glycosyltransferase involved in cell wall biosynthesis
MLPGMSELRVALDMTPARVSGAGIGRYAEGISAALERLGGLQVNELAAPLAGGGGREAAGGALAGRLARVAAGLAREGIYYPLLLGRRARAGGAQLVHCPAPYGPRLNGLPLVLSAHDVLPLSRPELFTRTMTAHMRHVSARHLRKAARVVCGSEHVLGELAELAGVDPARVTVTPYGVDPAFGPRPRPEGARPYVLCVGTLEPRKNLAGALRAFERAAPLELRLVIAGAQGWRNNAFERELRSHGERVELTGRISQDELVQLYAGAECLLFPSLAEGFGFPVLEAMACGTPVVAGNVTSIPELAGDAALLVDPRDDEALADALRRVLEDRDLAATLRGRGLERSGHFTWEACAAKTLDAYREALA